MACTEHLSNITSKYHSDPDVYITVAGFMYETYIDINEARRHFTEGLNYYKDYKPIHIEQFAMEVQHLDVTRGSTLKFALFNYQCLRHVYCGQIDFYFILLDKIMLMSQITDILEVVIGYVKNICEQNGFLNVVHVLFCSDMFLEFKDNKLMWQKLAQINEKGFIYDTNSQLIFYSYCDYCIIQLVFTVHNCV